MVRPPRILVGVAVAAAIVVSLVGASDSFAVTISEFSSGITPNAGLGDIAADAQGNLWFPEASAAQLGRMTPSGEVSQYKTSPFLNPSNALATTTVAVGRSGNVWVAGPDLEFDIFGFTPGGLPIFTSDTNSCESSRQLVAAVDGVEVISAAECGFEGGVELFSIDSRGHFFSHNSFPVSGTVGCGAANGPFLATGPGGRLWMSCYDEEGAGVVRLSATDPSEATWFGNGTTGGFVGIPGPVTVAPDGTAWFTQSVLREPFVGPYANAIGRITPQGQVTSFSAGLTGMGYHATGVHGITIGPDGNVWFTEPAVDRIGRITPSGVITEFPLPPGSRPEGITVGAGRNLWFTEAGTNRIGRLNLNEPPTPQLTVGGSLIASSPLDLDGASSSDGDGSIAGYRWDLGDGAVESGPRITHAYDRPGTYTITLVVTDNEGAQSQLQRQVVIAAPTLSIQRASAVVRWSVAGASGHVTIAGTSDRSARVAFVLARGKTRLALGELNVGQGPFIVTLRLPRTLRPGLYEVLGHEVSSNGATLQIPATSLSVAAPPQGIVDQAVVIDSRGRRVRAVRPLGTRRLSVRFRIVVAPRAGQKIQARWFAPGSHRAIVDPAPRRRRGGIAVTSIFSRAALPQGLYECQLRAAGKILASVYVRVG